MKHPEVGVLFTLGELEVLRNALDLLADTLLAANDQTGDRERALALTVRIEEALSADVRAAAEVTP